MLDKNDPAIQAHRIKLLLIGIIIIAGIVAVALHYNEPLKWITGKAIKKAVAPTNAQRAAVYKYESNTIFFLAPLYIGYRSQYEQFQQAYSECAADPSECQNLQKNEIGGIKLLESINKELPDIKLELNNADIYRAKLPVDAEPGVQKVVQKMFLAITLLANQLSNQLTEHISIPLNSTSAGFDQPDVQAYKDGLSILYKLNDLYGIYCVDLGDINAINTVFNAFQDGPENLCTLYRPLSKAGQAKLVMQFEKETLVPIRNTLVNEINDVGKASGKSAPSTVLNARATLLAEQKRINRIELPVGLLPQTRAELKLILQEFSKADHLAAVSFSEYRHWLTDSSWFTAWEAAQKSDAGEKSAIAAMNKAQDRIISLNVRLNIPCPLSGAGCGKENRVQK